MRLKALIAEVGIVLEVQGLKTEEKDRVAGTILGD